MNSTLLIAGRDFGAYFRSFMGPVIWAAVLLIDGLLFNAFVLADEQKRLSSDVLWNFFWISSGTTMIASIFLSMRLLAEERQTGTLVLLTSSPITDRQIVMGKWMSGFAFLTLITLSTLIMPALVMVHGKVSWGHIAAGYLGLLLLGGATLAIGTFGSALARSQVVAAVASACIVVAMLTCWYLAKVTERPLADVFTAMALHGRHFQPFQEGVVHLRDVVYYIVVTYVALHAATRVIEARRWR